MLNIVQNISVSNNGGEVKDYNMQIIQDKLNERVKLMVKDPQIKEILKTKVSEVGVEEAKEWLHYQTLITLMYTPAEREEMLKKKNN